MVLESKAVTLGERKEPAADKGWGKRVLKPRSLTFGGGARACGGRSANFSLSAAFRTCSSGTCRLTRSRKSRLERGTFSPETAGGAEVSGASHPHSRALPAVCTPHPPPRSPPGHSGSGTTFSAVPPRPLWHRTGPRLRPAQPATRDSGPSCSAAQEPLGPAALRASRSVWRRPAPSPTRLGRAAPGGSGPRSREQGNEEVGVGPWRAAGQALHHLTCRPLRAPPRRSSRPFHRPGLQFGCSGLSDGGLGLRLRSRPGSGTGTPGSGARGSGGDVGAATASSPSTDISSDSPQPIILA